MSVEPSIKIFDYLEPLDAFLPTSLYRELADDLGLMEWNHVVWIGRLLRLDNDVGEHWFDNWDLREARREQTERFGLDSDELLIIDPEKFQDGRDGPCHSSEYRKRFWTDVLKRLELGFDLIADEARTFNAWSREHFPKEYISDLEDRIERWRRRLTEQ